MCCGCELPLAPEAMPFHSLQHGSQQHLDEAFNCKMAGQEGIGAKPFVAQNFARQNCALKKRPTLGSCEGGFDVNFHTHLETTGEGKLVVMCFDEGYTIEQGEIRPCVNASTTLSS